MWVCLNDAFVSIVVDAQRPGNLLVRARRRADLRAVLRRVGVDGLPRISVSNKTDYRYRVSLDSRLVAELIGDAVQDIDYGNFKDSVEDRELHDMYALWWGDHLRYQRAEGER